MKINLSASKMFLAAGILTILILQSVASVAAEDEEYICWRVPKDAVWIHKGSPDADWGSLDFILRNKKNWTYQAATGPDFFLHKDGNRRLIAYKCSSSRYTIKVDFDGLRDSCGIDQKAVTSHTTKLQCPENYSLDDDNFCYENGVSPTERRESKTAAKCPAGHDRTLKRNYDKLFLNKTIRNASGELGDSKKILKRAARKRLQSRITEILCH